ncbi:MAG: terminase family protein [Candidatus Bathyarchaeia archaeon]
MKRAKEIEKEWLEEQKAKATEIPKDFVQFCQQFLGLKLTEYQREAAKLIEQYNDVALRWCRQSGKTHLIAAWLLHYALTHPGVQIAIVGPSWRQSMIPITKINYFRTKLPKGLFYPPQRSIVRLKNGSVIQAFPNNPNNLRGFTLHCVYADELNFIANDEEMYDAISFTLATTNGKFIASSTPWHTDSLFWKIFHDPAFKHFKTSHITYQQVLEQKGPITQEWLDKKRKEYEGDPWRWRREMMAEWAEDENVWLSQALITSCIDHELEYYDFEELATGEFYAGLDLGKYQDYSVLSVVQIEDSSIKLIHLHRFPLRTPYASVIGYVKTLCDRWQTINKVLVDMSGVGDYIVEDMINAGIAETEGIKFTIETKQEMAQWLKQCMIEKRLKIPYDSDLIAELNIERFELTKDGKIKFNHPEGTNDDRFWSLALAVYATRTEPQPKIWIIPRIASMGKIKLQKLRDRLRQHQATGVTR